MRAFDAACAGAYIHSKLGELIGPGLIAEDLIDNIPLMIKKLNSYAKKTNKQEKYVTFCKYDSFFL